MSKKWWIVVAVVVVVGGLGLIGYQYVVGRRQAVAEAQAEMETAVVRRDMLRVTVDATGNLAPNAEVSLAFSSGGQVVEVLVEEGQQVEEGDVLARLDDADAREAVANAEFQVTQAEINLASAQIEAEAGLAQANLDTAQVGYEEAAALAALPGTQLTSARVSLEQAQDALVEAQENYDNAWDQARDWELNVRWMKNALESEREATESALKNAQYNLEVSQANYSLAVVGISEENVQNTWAKVLNAQVSLESESLQLEQSGIGAARAGGDGLGRPGEWHGHRDEHPSGRDGQRGAGHRRGDKRPVGSDGGRQPGRDRRGAGDGRPGSTSEPGRLPRR